MPLVEIHRTGAASLKDYNRDVQKKTFFENLGIAITFDSLNGFSSLDPKNEALALLSRFLTFKYEIIF